MQLKKENGYLWGFALCIGVILSITPFFSIGFTTADDLSYYMTYLQKNYFTDAWNYAHYSGRFYFIITKSLYSFAYLFDNFYFTKIVQYLFLLISYSLFSFLIYKLFKAKYFSCLIFLLLVAFTTISPANHIPITSYPSFFTLSFSLMLISILFFIRYSETQKKKWLIFSVILFFITLLFYETYLIFLGLFCLALIVRNIYLQGFKNSFRKKTLYREVIPYIIAGLCYVIIYFGFRMMISYGIGDEQFYDGSRVAENFSLKNFFTILYKCNKAAIPGQIYSMQQHVIAANSPFHTGHINQWGYLLTHLSPRSFINVIILAALFLYFLLKTELKSSWKMILSTFVFSIFLTFFAHTLIGIAEKYNTYWYSWLTGYVTTYYSYFGIVMLIALIFYILLKLTSFKKWVKFTCIFLSLLVFVYYSVIIQYTNDHLGRDWQHSQNRFWVMDELIENQVFNSLPDDAVIYSPDLFQTVSINGKGICDGFDWGRYVTIKSGKRVNIYSDNEEVIKIIKANPEKELFHIQKNESFENNDVLIVLSKVNKESLRPDVENETFAMASCSEAQLFYYSPIKDFQIHYAVMNENPASKAVDSFSVSRPMNSFYFSQHPDNRKFSSVRIDGKNIIAGSFYVSGMK